MPVDRLRAAAIAVALCGVAVAAYLTLVHYTSLEAACTGDGGCERVQSSAYADLAGIPVALLGLAGYLAIAAALIGLRGEPGLLVPAALAIGGAAFSGYLQYRSLITLEATCPWCVLSAALMVTLAAVCVSRVLRAP